MWLVRCLSNPPAQLLIICASGWFYGYHHLLEVEHHSRAGTRSAEDGRRSSPECKIFAASFVTMMALKELECHRLRGRAPLRLSSGLPVWRYPRKLFALVPEFAKVRLLHGPHLGDRFLIAIGFEPFVGPDLAAFVEAIQVILHRRAPPVCRAAEQRPGAKLGNVRRAGDTRHLGRDPSLGHRK
jgi:hypothetical protein